MKFLPNRIKICEVCKEEIKWNVEYYAIDVLQNDGTMFTKTKHIYCYPRTSTPQTGIRASTPQTGIRVGIENWTYSSDSTNNKKVLHRSYG